MGSLVRHTTVHYRVVYKPPRPHGWHTLIMPLPRLACLPPYAKTCRLYRRYFLS